MVATHTQHGANLSSWLSTYASYLLDLLDLPFLFYLLRVVCFLCFHSISFTDPSHFCNHPKGRLFSFRHKTHSLNDVLPVCLAR